MQPARVDIIEATTAEQIQAAGDLLCAYAVSMGWDVADSRITHELELLPGPYTPPRGSLLLAYVDGAPAGVLGLQPVPDGCRVPGTGAERVGELKRLFVTDEFRRHGIGRSLMLRAETAALARGYDSLVLTTNAEMMPLAQPLYESLGYHETEPYRDDLTWPNLRWMRKELDGAR